MPAAFPLAPSMQRALALAEAAAANGEVPIGAVVTVGERIVGEGRNAMRGTADPTAHAEVVALRAAARTLATSRLDGCTLWVTLEPCAMCAAAASLARIARLVFGAEDPKGGAVVHGPRLYAQPTCHHRPEVVGGVGEAAAARLLRTFFQERRT